MYKLKRFKQSAYFSIKRTKRKLLYHLTNKYMCYTLIKYGNTCRYKTEYSVDVWYPNLDYTLSFLSIDDTQKLHFNYFNCNTGDKFLYVNNMQTSNKIIFESISHGEIRMSVNDNCVSSVVLNLLKSIKKGLSFDKSKRKMLALLT